VLSAFVVGSVAKGIATVGSDLDIAMVIPAKCRVSSLRFTERYHRRMALTGGMYPEFEGRRVDFQFFFPNDFSLLNCQRIKLK
jgi:predicted nucleotidyltransferase